MKLIERAPWRRNNARTAAGGPATASARLGWLDALRGIAALSVAVYHLALPFVWLHADHVPRYLDPGIFGVMLFFLVSGYIIPASLERRGDVRAFWAGRYFRIYPVVIVAVVASLLVLPRSHTVVQGWAFDHPLLTLAGNGLMVQDMMGVTNVIGVMWTLTYEMVFYYFVTTLFVTGRHRQSAPIAIGFAAGALVLGGWLPLGSITADGLPAVRNLVLAAGIVVVAAMACIFTGRADLTRWGGTMLGGLGLVLVLLNSRSAAFESLMVFATMFAGTVLYRLEHGQIDRTPAVLCCAFVLTAGFLSGFMYNHDQALWRTWSETWKSFSFAYLAAWVVFVLGMLLRRRRFPRALAWLGTISYSVYLLHNPLIHGMEWLLEDRKPFVSWQGRSVQFVAFMAALLLVSYLSYRLIEIPFQNLGRRAVKALNRRFPAEALPARPAGRAPGGPLPADAPRAAAASVPEARESAPVTTGRP
ncbi:acyltransferase family protein [Streptomyces sp. NRRL S-350]|uniref:acyltransferase family protein n=1 Tax=Streptomyces sp. NRRL S-350 TaxID=1463902 RepID=UPI00068E3D86|nr:acyltransferase [Streptomyces sp. NRRL S-350]